MHPYISWGVIFGGKICAAHSRENLYGSPYGESPIGESPIGESPIGESPIYPYISYQIGQNWPKMNKHQQKNTLTNNGVSFFAGEQKNCAAHSRENLYGCPYGSIWVHYGSSRADVQSD